VWTKVWPVNIPKDYHALPRQAQPTTSPARLPLLTGNNTTQEARPGALSTYRGPENPDSHPTDSLPI
jgi:phosphatidylethanolamine-binding protein (PEBP) family uncharacterized protein